MKPIILTSEQVRGAIDGTVTRIRVPVKPQPPSGANFLDMSDNMAIIATDRDGNEYPKDVEGLYTTFESDGYFEFPVFKAPFQPGDLLWVRETWCSQFDGTGSKVEYLADWQTKDQKSAGLNPYGFEVPRWRSSIHMPREAARLFLRVTDIRVERVQDITKEDAIAEGYSGVSWLDAKDIFITDWDKRYAKRGFPYASNPWTFVSTVEKEERP